MKKTTAVCSSEFEAQAQKTVSAAFALCESKRKTDRGNLTAELRALSAAALSLEKAIAAFIAARHLFK